LKVAALLNSQHEDEVVNEIRSMKQQSVSFHEFFKKVLMDVDSLNISFIHTIEFPYSTGDPLTIMPSPMLWQLSFLGCFPVAGEPSEH
jgi:hypothetical protein